MSGLMLASSCSAVGAEAPKGIKDRIINSVVKHKKLILTGAAIQAVADGALIWLLTHNNNIKMDYNKFENFDNFFGNFKKAAEACRKSLTVSNIKVRDARDLESKINNEATDNKTEKTEKTKEIVIEGINGLEDEVQGTLVLEKTKKSYGISIIKFKFIENEKAEERKEEKEEENANQETEVNEDKKENESQEPKVNEDKKENQGTKENKNQEENESQETEVNENQEEKDKEDNSEKDSDEE